VQKGAVKLQHISTNEQIADILTKPLVKGKFVYFVNIMVASGGMNLYCDL
jgi:hypothetical protein